MENDKVKFKNEFKARLYKWKVKNNFAILNCNFDSWYLHFDIESGRALSADEIKRLYNLGRWAWRGGRGIHLYFNVGFGII